MFSDEGIFVIGFSFPVVPKGMLKLLLLLLLKLALISCKVKRMKTSLVVDELCEIFTLSMSIVKYLTWLK